MGIKSLQEQVAILRGRQGGDMYNCRQLRWRMQMLPEDSPLRERIEDWCDRRECDGVELRLIEKQIEEDPSVN
jgi:hypothetical protein